MQFYSADEFASRLKTDFAGCLGKDFRGLEPLVYLDDNNIKKLGLSEQGRRREDFRELEVSSAYAQFRKSGMELEDFMKVLAKTYESTCRIPAGKMEEEQKIQRVSRPVTERLYLYPVDYRANRAELLNFPHIQKGGEALICLLETADDADGPAGYTAVSNETAQSFGMGRQRLFEEAADNTRRKYPSILSSAWEITGSRQAAFLPEIYVLSNNSGFCGGAALYYDADVLQNLFKEKDAVIAAAADAVFMIPGSAQELQEYERVLEEIKKECMKKTSQPDIIQTVTYLHESHIFACKDGTVFAADGIMDAI